MMNILCRWDFSEQIEKLVRLLLYTSVSQTVVLGFCPCGPFTLNISPKKTEKIKLT